MRKNNNEKENEMERIISNVKDTSYSKTVLFVYKIHVARELDNKKCVYSSCFSMMVSIPNKHQ